MIQSLAFEVSDKVSTEKKFKNFINFPELEDFNEFQLTMLIRFVTAFSNCSAHMVREVSWRAFYTSALNVDKSWKQIYQIVG